MSDYYYNEKGERVYGYTRKPANLYYEPPKSKTQTEKTNTKSGTRSAGKATDYYTAAIARQNDLLRQQYEEQKRQRKRSMQAVIDRNNAQAEDDMRRAYILNMMSQKNLSQKLKNLGLSGGASETVVADMNNTYMNNRNNIDRSRLLANSQAKKAYNEENSNAYQKYLSNQSQLFKSAFLNGNKAQQQALYNFLKAQGLA